MEPHKSHWIHWWARNWLEFINLRASANSIYGNIEFGIFNTKMVWTRMCADSNSASESAHPPIRTEVIIMGIWSPVFSSAIASLPNFRKSFLGRISNSKFQIQLNRVSNALFRLNFHTEHRLIHRFFRLWKFIWRWVESTLFIVEYMRANCTGEDRLMSNVDSARRAFQAIVSSISAASAPPISVALPWRVAHLHFTQAHIHTREKKTKSC